MPEICLQALADKAINIQVISTSEIKVSVLIAAEYTELAVRDVFSPGYAGAYKGKEILIDDDEEYFSNERFARPRMEVSEKNSAKEEIEAHGPPGRANTVWRVRAEAAAHGAPRAAR